MRVSPEHIWQSTLNQLQLQMTKATFETWFKGTRVVDQQNDHYTIAVRSNYAKAWLENRLHDKIVEAMTTVLEMPVQLKFVVLADEAPVSNGHHPTIASQNNHHYPEGKQPVNGLDEHPLNQPSSQQKDDDREQDELLARGGFGSGLKLRVGYTFERFIVGASNRLAHAAALAVAERPGAAHNPLFLYGGVGLGKTHLLHAVAHKALQNNKRVIYVTSETFTNDFINAIRRQSTETFREHYRHTDFLLVDDIQFIAGKESTQEEFFHTFNDIHAFGGQIVLTSDRLPRAIPTLEDRLSSRFEWGLLADVQAPDLETRLAILRFKADSIGVSVPNDVMDFVARRAQNNIRELEGALNRVVAHAALNQIPVSVEQAKAALDYLVTRREAISVDMVIEAVAEYYNLSIDELKGNSRSRRIAGPRQMVMYLAREETKTSLPQIGEALGGRDHTTIMYGYEKVGTQIEHNEKMRRDAMQIREQLYQKVNPN